MIYVDTSVVLAYLLSEARMPEHLWREPLVSNRLIEYEVWNVTHRRGLARTHGELVTSLLENISMIELAATVLSRARERFPVPVRTIDALHIASAEFLRQSGQRIEVATYNENQQAVFKALGFSMVRL